MIVEWPNSMSADSRVQKNQLAMRTTDERHPCTTANKEQRFDMSPYNRELSTDHPDITSPLHLYARQTAAGPEADSKPKLDARFDEPRSVLDSR